MANTLKTLQGEILVGEIEAITVDNVTGNSLPKNVVLPCKVVVVGKSGIKYDLTNIISGTMAYKTATAAIDFVAGIGHQVFDAAQVK